MNDETSKDECNSTDGYSFNKDSLLLKATKLGKKSFFMVIGEEYTVLSSGIINTMNFVRNNGREQDLPRIVYVGRECAKPSILPHSIHKGHTVL